MRRWRVIEIKTKAIWQEYIQDEEPKWDMSWPPDGYYELVTDVLSSDERRAWARDKRQVFFKGREVEFLEAVLFNALGDSEFLSDLKQELSDLLLNYPKDPGEGR